MGFFSWDCEICGHPLLSPYVTDELNDWMGDGVALESDGSILRGDYDGYGRLGEHELSSPQVYHQACWELAGRPSEFEKESVGSRDQGYFFDDGAHSCARPETVADCEHNKKLGTIATEMCSMSWKSIHDDSTIMSAENVVSAIVGGLAEGTVTIPESLREELEKVAEQLSKNAERIRKKDAEAQAARKAERIKELQEYGNSLEEATASAEEEFKILLT